ncbi:Uncharacterized protein HZ326_27407 [Fusarium oxysporum f. sp. albedinis]|nr:Uncharacterized protein HZ326_27407 [Fusarium oxysporum f. sp. albedinis]
MVTQVTSGPSSAIGRQTISDTENRAITASFEASVLLLTRRISTTDIALIALSAYQHGDNDAVQVAQLVLVLIKVRTSPYSLVVRFFLLHDRRSKCRGATHCAYSSCPSCITLHRAM